MSKIQDEAKRLGMQVDHYYPLGGKMVSGLHCEANLRIVTREENLRKGSAMPKDDPHAWLPLPQYQQLRLCFDVDAPSFPGVSGFLCVRSHLADFNASSQVRRKALGEQNGELVLRGTPSDGWHFPIFRDVAQG